MARVLLAMIMVASVGGCDAPSGPEQVCARVTECGALPDSWTADSCVRFVSACVAALPAPEREFWDEHMDGCFDLDACDAFADCWSLVSQC